MPIYEYRCPNGHTFELFQRMTDPAPSECQICGAAPLQKVLYRAAILLMSSGFYSTDYGRGGRKKETSSDGDKPAEKADKADKKPDKPSESKKAAEA